MQVCGNIVGDFRLISEICNSADDSCICHYGYCRFIAGSGKAASYHSSDCIRLNNCRRFRFISGVINIVSKLYQCGRTCTDRSYSGKFGRFFLFYSSSTCNRYIIGSCTCIYTWTMYVCDAWKRDRRYTL